MVKITTTVGAFIGFLSPDGKILLRRREETDSIIPNVSFKGNWELPGGGVEESDVISYNLLIETAFREAEEEVGIRIAKDSYPFMGPLYSAVFKGQGYDLSVVIPFATDIKPTKGIVCLATPMEVEHLAIEFVSATESKNQGLPEARGLLSGYRKRMHCMALAALTHSPNMAYAIEAKQMLDAIRVRL